MPRSLRKFQPATSELEGRQLLTAGPGSHRSLARGDTVSFSGPAASGTPALVLQQDGTATVFLALNETQNRYRNAAPVQVLVETDPSSPAVGVNVGAVHQVVTVHKYVPNDPVIIPILPDAPNPGEVDVTLTITPINPRPNLKVGPPLHLKVLASEDMLPPTIESTQVTRTGVLVKFSKPMDPAGASNVNNFAVKTQGPWSGGGGMAGGYDDLLNPVFLVGSLFDKESSPPTPTYLRLKSAQYDPETQTVTLVPQRKIKPRGSLFSVTLRQPNGPGGRGSGSNHGPLLTDLSGRRVGGLSRSGSVPSGPVTPLLLSAPAQDGLATSPQEVTR
jgi:hypothetical protein